ncbi:hypothetical protein LTR53_000899 [Teratosphaeriaceae sp. CCFEE 6253]|nr:hypothetical protein LTR53_000899 [Teratosphaeriaceae sp. CCFEE 6253]
MVTKPSRHVYSAEELHRLRDTKSQPKLCEAIEEHDGDDAELVKATLSVAQLPTMGDASSPPTPTHQCWVYDLVDSLQHDELTVSGSEHVLRGSKSWAARSWKSRTSASTSLHAQSNKENRSTNASDTDRPVAPLASKPVAVLGEIAGNNQVLRPPVAAFHLRPSPTHSLRRKKIESLVKAHGSPDHVRVTAGGRIVPSEQSPLCHPRYGYSAIKSNGGLIKFAPNHPMGKAQWTHATQNGFVAQDVNGRLCQIVDGVILPLHETDEGLRLYMPAPNLNITQGPSSVNGHSAVPNRFAGGSNLPPPPAPRAVQDPPVASQINALEVEYVKLEHELKDVDKTEVLHGRTMGKGAKDALVAKRRELIGSLDRIRRALKSLRDEALPGIVPTSPRANMYKQQRAMSPPPRNRLPAFLQQRQINQHRAPPTAFGAFYDAAQGAPFAGPYGFQSTPSPEAGFAGQPWALPPPAMFAPPSAFDGSISSMALPYPTESYISDEHVRAAQTQSPRQAALVSIATESRLPQNDGSRSCIDMPRLASPLQSRALSIKVPETKVVIKSTLNPMSPVYKPGPGLLHADAANEKPEMVSIKDRVPSPLSPLHQLRPSTSSTKGSKPDGTTDSPTTTKHDLRSSSVSSFQTADFFPHNTRDFSARSYAHTHSPQSAAGSMKENLDPVTPARDITHAHPTPVAPPATPIDGVVVPDRSAHNLSPKNKWVYPSITDEKEVVQTVSAAPIQPRIPMTDADVEGRSREWLAGYKAALASQQSLNIVPERRGSRAVSPALSGMSSLGSRPGRIFSGLFAQLQADNTGPSSLDATLYTQNIAAAPSPASPPTAVDGNHDGIAKPTGASPARARFERIAESVGIKVDNLSPTKRRWRDVWRGSKP